ncbi:DedA family protein [Methanosarcina sp. UBA5]|uniref:DedA family protein n=1 Tax=Methanosarcina sp. UBA5 TaxID=1915593 RepID=UPI0025EFE5BF|nr:DedA family protein [Methanosarcina sp. UBA5]
MENLNYFIDLFLHLDTYLSAITNEYGLLTYLLLFAIIFCETGLVITPFLPGDSLVFATGALAASGSFNLFTIFVVLCLAAVAGDTVNYQIGHLVGNRVTSYENIRFIKQEHLDRTHAFFEKYGVKTIILARFVPVIRTFAPFVAGIGTMPYSTFISYNVVGGVAWVMSFFFGGYFFGNLPVVKDNFSFVILGIIFVSLLPGAITYIQSKRDPKKT